MKEECMSTWRVGSIQGLGNPPRLEDGHRVHRVNMPTDMFVSALVLPLGLVRARVGYLLLECQRLEQLGYKVVAYSSESSGDKNGPFYGDVLFTHRKFIKDNPNQLRRFIAATRAGWKKAKNLSVKDRKALFEAIRADADFEKTFQKRVLDSALKCTLPNNEPERFGDMKDAVWVKVWEAMEERGLIKPERLGKDALKGRVYMTEFL